MIHECAPVPNIALPPVAASAGAVVNKHVLSDLAQLGPSLWSLGRCSEVPCLPCRVSFVCSGEFVVVNKHLLSDLIQLGLWSGELKNEIMYHSGSIQALEGLPAQLKDIYK